MKNHYSTLDDVVLTFSDIEENNGFDEISVRFERVDHAGGFDLSEGKLPNNIFYKSFGFSEDDLMELGRYLKNNEALIWEIARENGGTALA